MKISVTEVNDVGGYEINTPFLMIVKATDAKTAEAAHKS